MVSRNSSHANAISTLFCAEEGTNPETAAVHRLRYYALTECSAMTFSD